MVAQLLALLSALIDVLGPAVVRKHLDEWEAARAVSDVAFKAKFGEKP